MSKYWLCINLDERKDRLFEITKQMESLEIDFTRFPAIKHENGVIGCMASHIACLELALNNNYPYVVIMEDDCQFNVDSQEIKNYISGFLKTDCPFFIFGATNITRLPYNELFCRGKNFMSATCYIVKNEYMSKLLKLWKTNFPQLVNTNNHDFCGDCCWKILQEKDCWLVPKKEKVICQRPGFSNIQNGFVNYQNTFS